MQPEFSSMRLIRMSCQRPSVMSITYAVRTFFFLDSWILLCGNSETTQSLELERKQIWSCWDAQSHCLLSNFETYPLTPCSVVCSWGICTSLHKSPWKPDRNHPMRQTIHDNPTMWALYGHCMGIVFLRCFWYDFWSPNLWVQSGTVKYVHVDWWCCSDRHPVFIGHLTLKQMMHTLRTSWFLRGLLKRSPICDKKGINQCHLPRHDLFTRL